MLNTNGFKLDMTLPFIVMGIAAAVFVLILVMIFSSRGRSAMMRRQLNIQKRTMEDNMDLLEDVAKMANEVGIDVQKDILENRGEDLTSIENMKEETKHEAIRQTAAAIKEGLAGETIYCKHCGRPIPADSRFCKHCGGEQ